jgi:hypothetical protein
LRTVRLMVSVPMRRYFNTHTRKKQFIHFRLLRYLPLLLTQAALPCRSHHSCIMTPISSSLRALTTPSSPFQNTYLLFCLVIQVVAILFSTSKALTISLFFLVFILCRRQSPHKNNLTLRHRTTTPTRQCSDIIVWNSPYSVYLAEETYPPRTTGMVARCEHDVETDRWTWEIVHFATLVDCHEIGWTWTTGRVRARTGCEGGGYGTGGVVVQ